MSHEPFVGQAYNVVCPDCCETHTFTCRSLAEYGTRCSTCGVMIDLRDPERTLAKDDPIEYENGEQVAFSASVEASNGLSADAQVRVLRNHMNEEKEKVLPKQMGNETIQAFSAQKNQAIAEKFSFFYPVTHFIERHVFGEPFAKIGHVRIFRKRIPFLGVRNFPAAKTTTSYAAPSVFVCISIIGFTCFCFVMNFPWMFRVLWVEWVHVFFFYFLLFSLAYSDPGYIRPGYMTASTEAADQSGHAAPAVNGLVEREGRANATTTTAAAAAAAKAPATTRLTDELTLKDLESNQRPSKWEIIGGVPMEKKWCSTCEMHRPARAAHCYLCGLCVYDHDHHCSVVGCCVGRRHCGLFSLFVSNAAWACVMPTICYGICFHKHRDMLATWQLIIFIILSICLLFFSVILSATAAGMCQSVWCAETTRERLQNVYAMKRNPYNKGIMRNLYTEFVTRKTEPSLFDDEFVKLCAQRQEQRELGTGFTVTCA